MVTTIMTWDDISEYVSISKIENPNYDVDKDTDIRAILYAHLCKHIPHIQIGSIYYVGKRESYNIKKTSKGSEFIFYSSISRVFYDILDCDKMVVCKILSGYLKQTFDMEFDEIW
jgi:hypothetical protein